MTEDGDPETIEEALELFDEDLVELFQDRVPWLEVAAVPNISGRHGTDIVIRFDGSYYVGDRGYDQMVRFCALRFQAAMIRSGIRPGRDRPGRPVYVDEQRRDVS